MINFTSLKAGIEDGSINETNISCYLHGKGGYWLSVLKWLSDLVALNGGLVIPEHDYEGFAYVGATNNVSTITYKTGGAADTTVATLTFTYVGAGAADDDDVASITLT